MKVVVLGMGGTIAGVEDASAHGGYRAGQVPVGALVGMAAVPAGCEVVAEQVAQVDSKDMDDVLWRTLALRARHWLAHPDVVGVVVTHGTDTLEETAFFLHSVLEAAKPLVLTGAMRPATDAQPDGPQNLHDAIALACTPGARGVLVVFAGRVFAGSTVRKVHPRRLDAFEGDGDGSGIGTIGPHANVAMSAGWPDPRGDYLPGALDKWCRRLDAGRPLPWVAWVASHAGATGAEVRALLDAGVEGLVVGGTGNGTLHRRLEAAIEQARARGVPVAIGSRCGLGDAQGEAGTTTGARRAHADARHIALQPAKARIALQLRLLGEDD